MIFKIQDFGFKLAVPFLAFVLSLYIGICFAEEPAQKVPEKPSPTSIVPSLEQQKKLIAASNQFGFRLYSQLASKQDNFIFSPFAIESAFALPFSGAQDITKIQMKSVFGFSDEMDNPDGIFFAISRPFNENSSDFFLALSNSLWLQKGFEFLPAFVKMASQSKAALMQADFKKYPDTAKDQINRWMRERTHSCISDLINSLDISRETRLLIASGACLQADWKNIFDMRLSTLRPFFSSNKETANVAMMQSTASYSFYEENDFSLLELEFAKQQSKLKAPTFAMWIILPKSNDGLAKLEGMLNHASIQKWLANLSEQKITIFLPKFKIMNKMPLEDALSNMGMRVPFSNQANFLGLSGAAKGIKMNAQHQSTLMLDERGINNVSRSSNSFGYSNQAAPILPYLFQADHPFCFLVIDKKTGLILFLGRFVNPI